MQFHTSLHSKFQIRDWLKLTSACELTNLRSADVNLSQSRIWNLEWSKVQKCTIIADIIVHFCTSLHSKFQIRDWLKLTSAERRLVRLQADINFSQSRIWNLDWSEVLNYTIIAAIISLYGYKKFAEKIKYFHDVQFQKVNIFYQNEVGLYYEI